MGGGAHRAPFPLLSELRPYKSFLFPPHKPQVCARLSARQSPRNLSATILEAKREDEEEGNIV